MPTLGAMLLGDVRKDDASELQDLSDREVKDAPGYRTKAKRKNKSVTLGKGGPGSGPHPGGGKVYDKAAKVARSAERTANATRTPQDHTKAAAAHRDAAKVATGVMRGVHEKAAAVHDYLAAH